jgi:hypothetical protein
MKKALLIAAVWLCGCEAKYVGDRLDPPPTPETVVEAQGEYWTCCVYGSKEGHLWISRHSNVSRESNRYMNKVVRDGASVSIWLIPDSVRWREESDEEFKRSSDVRVTAIYR